MSGGRGAGDLPLTWHGTYDATMTYLPRQVVTYGGAIYMAVAKTTGSTPSQALLTPWLPLAGGGPIYLEAVVASGAAAVATDVLPPGFRAPADTTLRAVYLNAKTAPTGSALTYVVKRLGVTIATVSIAAGATSGSTTGLSVALAKNDMLPVDCTAVGSTVAGADVLLSIEAY